MAVSDDPRDDLRAALATRQELGPDFEPEIIESFLERLDRTIEARVDAAISARQTEPAPKKGTPAELVFASMLGGTLVTTAIGLTMHAAGLPAVFLVWVVVAVVNIAHAVAAHRH